MDSPTHQNLTVFAMFLTVCFLPPVQYVVTHRGITVAASDIPFLEVSLRPPRGHWGGLVSGVWFSVGESVEQRSHCT
jgi:hypothetical protein